MHRWFRLVLALVCLCLGTLPCLAQLALPRATEDLATTRQHLSALSGPWLFHAGDDPAWASPGLDDSAWTTVAPGKDWVPQGYQEQNGFAWFRFRLLVPPHTGSLVLTLPKIEKCYQLFVNGSPIAQVGRIPPGPAGMVTSAPRAFTLPVPSSAAPQVVTVALRLWQLPRLAGLRPSVLRGTAYAGEGTVVMRQFALTQSSRLLSDGGRYTKDLVLLIVALASLLLYLLTRGQRFYLWFTAFALIDVANLPISHLSQHFAWPFLLTVNAYLLTDLLGGIALVLLVVDILQFPWSRAVLPSALLVLAEVGVVLITWFPLPLAFADSLYFFGAFTGDGLLLLYLIQGWRRGNTDARLLLIPYLIDFVIAEADNLGHLMVNLNLPAQRMLIGDVVLLHEPFTVSVQEVGDVISALGMLAVLVYRFARTTREKERLSSALQAAHDVQYQLVPRDLPRVGGFSTEVSYMAAEEVGGDFCQVLPRPDGSVLIAIGDVSGKGLRAAMLGTLCVGALRSMADDDFISPIAALDRLNKVVLRTEYAGFITCLCAEISANGHVRLANAGHLAPYINGEEVPVPSGLPLGIVSGAEYDEMTLQLPADARLTLLSDGVVEARSPSGELFGFDRTLQVSRLPAGEIAAHAQRYGPQQDDITVLTLQWSQPMVASVAA